MTEYGEPEVLKYVDSAIPVTGRGQVLVKLSAIGVNFVDIYRRQGIYPVALPHTPGGEGAGVIVALGEGVGSGNSGDVAVGDRVAFAETYKTYAEFVVVDVEHLLPVPDGVDDTTAAAIPLQGMTAHYLATSVFPLAKGHTALIHAGAGGVGLLLTQLAKARGAHVITTVSTPEKAELSRQAGSDHVIYYEEFDKTVRDLTGGVGVDVVYDGVGRDTFDQSLACLRVRGLLALFGAASGPVPPFDLSRLAAAGSLSVIRPSMGNYLQTAEERRWRSGELFDAIVAGTLKVRIGATYPLADAAKAHEDLAARRTTGKVLLVP
ncbi:quinone oxidoreductase family protein [Alpinimonas psychrophila]|nr:quinone oxidoreductase [Alpinimonas psychrophila]